MRMRLGLVGCVKPKLPHAAPARELYTSALFWGRRVYVERTCDRWFILSAKHALVDPEIVLQRPTMRRCHTPPSGSAASGARESCRPSNGYLATSAGLTSRPTSAPRTSPMG
jgi:hypothetical protein